MRLTARVQQGTRMLVAAAAALTLATLGTLAILAGPVQAQDAEWKRLNQDAERLFAQGSPDQAVLALRQALGVAEATFGPDHANVDTSLNKLAQVYGGEGRYAQAEPLYRRSVAIREKALGTEHPFVATTLNHLANLYRIQGRYAQAEPVFRRSLAIREKVLGPEHPDVAVSLNNLAEVYRSQGRYAPAEPLYMRALAIWEKTRGPDHPDVAACLNNLAELYGNQGRHAQAEPFFRRSLAIMEKAFGPEHPDVAVSLNNLANLYRIQDRFEQAVPLFRRSLSILEKALGAEHPLVATSLNNLAAMYASRDRFAQAEPLYQRSLAIREKALGADHPDVATSLNNLAELYVTQGRNAQAEPLYIRSLAILEKALGPDSPVVAASLNNLAGSYAAQGRHARALPPARRASAIYRQRIVAGGTGDAGIREAAQNRSGFLTHLAVLASNPLREAAEKITEESLQIAQLNQASGTASAIAKMTARFAGGNDALAGLVKRKQDAAELRARHEALLLAAASRPPQERRTADEQRMRDDIALAGRDIETLDAELSRRFPDYQALTRPEPLSAGQIRALLKPGEAMLVYVLGDSSFLWVVKPEGANFVPLRADAKDVTRKVAAVRAEMESDGSDNAPRVSVGALHDLYRRLFAPAIPHLSGVRHVMVVPAGPLQSLPLAMLVASPPPEIRGNADYVNVDWLTRHYALSVLPSVGSIQALRQFARSGNAQEPFAGFGDPLIGGEAGGATRGRRAKPDVAGVFRNLVIQAAATEPAYAQAAEIADVEAIRGAARLPETADELRAMARVLNAGPKSLWLQEHATETNIKRIDLSRYRTLAFATHGVMAGEIRGIGEAGLILTPPKQGTVEDDGYLSASEIAKLTIHADWVLLSACNTAASDGTPGAEGLSGLAKAFFYAGTRSLLVSHWPVASAATVPLTTGMMKEYEANPGQGKAEAHRRAMLALIETPHHPEYAHPLFWAPFVVVGEGGAGTPGNAGLAGRARQ